MDVKKLKALAGDLKVTLKGDEDASNYSNQLVGPLAAKLETLTGQLEAEKTNHAATQKALDDLKAAPAADPKALEDQAAQIADKDKTIEELMKALNESKAQEGTSNVVVSHKGKFYEVLAPQMAVRDTATRTRVTIKAEDLKTEEHAATLEWLIEKKSGLIREVQKPAK